MQKQTFQDAFQRLMRIQQQKKELPKQTLQQLKMADDFFDNKDFASAINLYDKIVKVFKKYYGKTDPKTIEIYYKMAKSLQELGTRSDYLEAIDLYKIVMDNSDPNSDMFKLSLAHTFFLDKESEMGTEKALEIYQPLLAKYTEKYGPDDPRTMEIYNYTARAVSRDDGDLQKSQQMYKKISQYRKKIKEN
jgi:tetratricopeptide (TPR) repeat protein